MPGLHSAKEKRMAQHIVESAKKRGYGEDRAKEIGWATVNKYKKKTKGRKVSKAEGEALLRRCFEKACSCKDEGGTLRKVKKASSLAHVQSQLSSASSVASRGSSSGKPAKTPSSLAHVQRQLNSASSVVGKSKRKKMKKDMMPGAGLPGGEAYAAMGKSRIQLVTFEDLAAERVAKAEGGAPAPKPAEAPGAAPAAAPKKFPRKMKPTVRMKPITDEEAIANLRSGKYYEKGARKALRMLAALKALTTGYSKVSGGGALKAPNRGYRGTQTERDRPIDLALAMEGMTPPPKAGPPKVYLPGVHSPKSPVRRQMGLKKPGGGTRGAAAASSSSAASSSPMKAHKKPKLKKTYPTLNASMTPNAHSSEAPRALDGGGATELSNSVKNVVHKSEGATTMGKTNFNDIFKSELGISNEEVLCNCPECDAPITKSSLAKARGHKGKGKTTHVTGPKQVNKEGGELVHEQNPTGGTMRGGEGRGVLMPSRGVPGAKKTDEVTGVQNSKGSKARKSDAVEAEGDEVEQTNEPEVKKSQKPAPAMTIRGTEWVQYIENHGSGGDADIAKSIAEGMGGTQPTQPLDMNNDLTRLLI